MKSKVLAISLFVATAGVIGFYPMYQASQAKVIPGPDPVTPVKTTQAKRIDLVFALDTTGSMSGMIQAAKEKIWSIATNMAQANSSPEIRIGLVAFRDRGDSYVTKIIDLSSDLDTVYAQLMDLNANGGGDHPESVNQAINDAVHKLSWSPDQNVYKALFLVGDAPPHMDYQNDTPYTVSINEAKNKGIIFNTIQCGRDPNTLSTWTQMASLSGGAFFNVSQDGNAVAMSTPYDKELAKLSKEMDETRLYYGSEEKMKVHRGKVAATEKLHESASVESRARRATYNSSKSGEVNAIGDGDLVSDISSGRVKLDEIPKAELPKPVATLEPEQQKHLIEETSKKRKQLKEKLGQLAKQRQEYIKQELVKRKDTDESLDSKLVGTLRAQAAKKGLVYEDETVTH